MIIPGRNLEGLDERLLNKLIDEDILLREAQKLNLHEHPEYRDKVENFKKELLVNLYLKRYLKELNTEENQRNYFKGIKEKFRSPAMVRISVILVKTEDEVKEILKKVQEGEDFAELARKYSKASSARRSGDFGFRTKQVLRKELADIAFSMKKGDVSDPVRTDEGFYLIKVTDRREERSATFEEVKPKVASEFMNRLLEEKISELRKALNIRTDSVESKNL
ncbi:MAG: peptidylprolyl isomerase [Nitrospirota bacterium]